MESASFANQSLAPVAIRRIFLNLFRQDCFLLALWLAGTCPRNSARRSSRQRQAANLARSFQYGAPGLAVMGGAHAKLWQNSSMVVSSGSHLGVLEG